MAKQVRKKSSKTVSKKVFSSPFNIYWKSINYYLLIAGILVVIIGFYIMSIGNWDSTTSLIVSPIILFIAYVIIFPLSILFKKKEDKKEEQL